MSLAKRLSVLFIFSKNQLLVSLILVIVFFVYILFLLWSSWFLFSTNIRFCLFFFLQLPWCRVRLFEILISWGNIVLNFPNMFRNILFSLHVFVILSFFSYVYAKSLQSCLTLCNTMHHSPPDSSVHGILQARILEWVGVAFSGGSSWPRDRTWFSCIGRWVLYL